MECMENGKSNRSIKMVKRKLFLLFLATWSFSVSGQMTGGKTKKTSTSTTNEPVKNKQLQGGSFFIGLNEPIGKTGAYNDEVSFYDALGLTSGLLINFQHFKFYDFDIGVNIGYEFYVSGSLNYFDSRYSEYGYGIGVQNSPFIIGRIGFGPAVHFPLNNKVFIEGAVRANVGAAAGGQLMHQNNFDSNLYWGGGTGFGINPVARVRFDKLKLECGLHLSNTQYTTGDFTDSKTPESFFQIGLGFQF